MFTIILLGESLLSSATALLETLHEGEHLGALLTVCLATFIISACLWWIYFWPTHQHAITSFRQVFTYAYSHYIIFASIGALSIGTELIVDYIKGDNAVLAMPQLGIRLVYCLPVAFAVLVTWFVVAFEQVPSPARWGITVLMLMLLVCGCIAVPLPYIVLLPMIIMMLIVGILITQTQATK